MTGARLAEVPVSSDLTVHGLRKAVRAERDFGGCRVDFLHKGAKLSEGEALLTDLLDFGSSNTAEVGLVKVKEVVRETSDDGVYEEVRDVEILSEGTVSYVMFTIQGASHDAHFGLFPGAVDVRRPFYEFVIDGWGGWLSGIRRGRGADPEATARGSFLDADQSRAFWVSVDSSSGNVAMGLGTQVSEQTIMCYADPAVLTPASVGIMTKHGASARWTFSS